MNKLNAIITGVAGQDGSYLAEFLLDKGYTVVGVSRYKNVNSGLPNLVNVIDHPNFYLTEGDINDPTFISRLLYKHRPHEYYNLAAQSSVGHSFQEPLFTFQTDAQSVLMQLEMIRQFSPYTRFMQASTSEIFGGQNCPAQGYNEETPLNPRSPYAVAKASAFWAVRQYRASYSLFACNAISFNHSSPRRGADFATRKITQGVAKIKAGLASKIRMGDLSAFRDEGDARDFVEGFHMMLQRESADDFIFSAKSGATIKEMLEYVAGLAGLTLEEVYEQDPRFLRPSDVPFLLGDNSKAQSKLGWKPKQTWKDLLKEMYENDLKSLG